MSEWRAVEYALEPSGGTDHEAAMWGITVAWRGPGDLWAVLRGCYMSGEMFCFTADGSLGYTRPPEGADIDEWRSTHRFSLTEAMALGERLLPTIVINGMTWAQVEAWRSAGHPRDDSGRPVIPTGGES